MKMQSTVIHEYKMSQKFQKKTIHIKVHIAIHNDR